MKKIPGAGAGQKYNSYNIFSLYKVHQQQRPTDPSRSRTESSSTTLPVSMSFLNIILIGSLAEPVGAGAFWVGAGAFWAGAGVKM